MIFICKALEIAGEKYPEEALQYDAENIDDIHVHYDYLLTKSYSRNIKLTVIGQAANPGFKMTKTAVDFLDLWVAFGAGSLLSFSLFSCCFCALNLIVIPLIE